MTSQSIKRFTFVVLAGAGLLGVSFMTVSGAHAQVAISEQGVTFPDNSLQTTATRTRYAIGDVGPGGGIVFHVIELGFHGLEAAPVDQSTGVDWCPTFTDIVGVVNIIFANPSAVDPNSGSHNTPLIVAECGATSAAGVAANYVWPNGQTDGFLPNKEELNLLYLNKDAIGGFANGFYWSSSESTANAAWFQFFGDGFQSVGLKDEPLRVRAVRAF
jgi:hypothetical protein